MKKIVICGYHGFANSGDEALLKAMIDILKRKQPDLSITVLSMHPESTKKLYNVDSVYRYNLFKIYRLFKSSDLFIFGGGSLLQDITSKRSLYYYLTIINMALKSGIKVMLYGNGIGPLTDKKSRIKTAKCLNKVDLITLRDDLSDKLLSEIGVTAPDIHITSDPAFTLQFDDLQKNDSLLCEAGIDSDTKYAVVAVRDWKDSVSNFNDIIAKFCDNISRKHNISPLFIPMQYKEDEQIALDIISRMDTKGYIIRRNLEIDEVFSLIGFSTLALGMRLHMLIYATTLGIPVIALSYDTKVSAFMQSLHQPISIDVDNISEDSLLSASDKLIGELSKRKDDIKESLFYLRKKAEENADYAIGLLNSEKK
ncbi:MAG: polysaccharide pyruvyl transferase CsaB [Clostridia bacterium]|nr:polysaccharide pyruvyl transferase CsaB [Clostridia bacterium]